MSTETGEVQPIQWLVSNLIGLGGLFLLVADPKTGKSLTTTRLALDVAAGRPFLGRDTMKRPVVMLAAEDGPTRLGSRCRDLFKISPDSTDNVVAVFAASQVKELLAELTAEGQSVLLIIDPLVNVLMHLDAPDENSAPQVNHALDLLHVFCHETNSTVVLVHHLTKGNDKAKKSPRGSTAIVASVDGWIEMTRLGRRTERIVRCTPTLRDGEVEPFSIQFVDTPTGLELVVRDDHPSEAVESGKAAAKSASLEAVAGAILAELRNEPLANSTLEKRVGRSRGVIEAATARLAEEGMIERVNGNPKGKWRLCEAALLPSLPASLGSFDRRSSHTGEDTNGRIAPPSLGPRSESEDLEDDINWSSFDGEDDEANEWSSFSG